MLCIWRLSFSTKCSQLIICIREAALARKEGDVTAGICKRDEEDRGGLPAPFLAHATMEPIAALVRDAFGPSSHFNCERFPSLIAD
jgi:hypothetical protein